jgi:hypothetical protein
MSINIFMFRPLAEAMDDPGNVFIARGWLCPSLAICGPRSNGLDPSEIPMKTGGPFDPPEFC